MTEMLDWWNTPDTFCAGLAEIEPMSGGAVRLSFYTTRKVGEEIARVLTASLVMAAETAAEAGQRMARASTEKSAGTVVPIASRH